MMRRLHEGGGLALVALTLISVAAVSTDQLRNIKRGHQVPPLNAIGLDGKPINSADTVGTVRVLLYLRAHQERSEQALASAHRIVERIGGNQLRLIYLSAAVDQADHFRQLRDRLKAHEPFALDKDREYYGRLGLIVCPTTVIVSNEGRLLHVIASWTRDYDHQLETRCRHALGELDDAELAKRLTVQAKADDDARARADQHRAVAAVLRSKGMSDNAIRELEQALAADPSCADATVELAEILIARENLDDAEKHINELLARQPAYPSAKLTLGLIRLKRGQLDDAERILKEALLLNPDPVRAHYYLGRLYEQRGEHKLAMEHYRDGLERSLELR